MKTAGLTLLAFGVSFLVVYVGVKIRRGNKILDKIAKKAKDQGIGDGWEDDEHRYL